MKLGTISNAFMVELKNWCIMAESFNCQYSWMIDMAQIWYTVSCHQAFFHSDYSF